MLENPYMIAKNAIKHHDNTLIAFPGMYIKILAKADHFEEWCLAQAKGTPIVNLFKS
jgi:hypothetical protein